MKNIEDLKRQGKIRGYELPAKQKGYSSDNGGRQSRKTSKALTWLNWNLEYWSNENALTIEKEYKFCPDRGWRWDYCWPSVKVALEYEGGIFMQKSGHTNVAGMVKDSDKYNRATVLGWRLIRVTALNYTTALSQLNALIK